MLPESSGTTPPACGGYAPRRRALGSVQGSVARCAPARQQNVIGALGMTEEESGTPTGCSATSSARISSIRRVAARTGTPRW